MRQLDVFAGGNLAGRLTEFAPGKGYSFVYDGDYLDSDCPSISVLLPKSGKEFHSDDLFPFFVNMLPEGANRRIICRDCRLDENDNFGILVGMADADFISAISFERV